MLELNKVYCMDALEFLKQIPDKSVDLVLTDPPYGIEIAEWDKLPEKIVFDEIFRVSKNQIIFGGNYFNLPHTESWICWDKTYKYNQGFDMSEFELIWTSFKHKSKFIRYTCCGNFRGFEHPRANYNKKENEHPTQKPEEVIRWLLEKFSNENDLVLDCFMGSGTTAVVCKQLGRNFICGDNCQEYVNIANKRLEQGVLSVQGDKGDKT